MRLNSKSLVNAALAISLLAVPAYASAQPTKAAALSLAQGAAEASKPYCSSKITTDCRKRRAKGAWIVLGAGAVAGAIAAATDGGSVSP